MSMNTYANPLTNEFGDWVRIVIGNDQMDLSPTEAMGLAKGLISAMESFTPDDVGECLSCGGMGFMLRRDAKNEYSIQCSHCSRMTPWLPKEKAIECWDSYSLLPLDEYDLEDFSSDDDGEVDE